MVVLYAKNGRVAISLRQEEYKTPLDLLLALRGHPDGRRLLDMLETAQEHERRALAIATGK